MTRTDRKHCRCSPVKCSIIIKLVLVDCSFLHPLPDPSQASHSADTIRITLLSDRHAVCLRTVMRIRPSAWACLGAFLTVVRLTPATAAILSMNQSQERLRWHCRAITVRAAISPVVKFAAIVPGTAPEAAGPRRRATDLFFSGDLQGRGRDLAV
jgi:hypothetical protein